MANKYLVQISTITDNIIDFIDENGPSDIGDNVDAIEKAIGKAEVMRNDYRQRLKEAQLEFGDEKFEELFGKESVITLNLLKNHISFLKQHICLLYTSPSPRDS